MRWTASATTRRIGRVVRRCSRRLSSSSPRIAADSGVSTQASRDQIHTDWREFEREILRHGGHRGRQRRDQRESHRRTAATGAADEEQRPSRANLAGSVTGDVQRQQDVSFQVATCRVKVEIRERRVVGARTRDQNVIDRPGQLVEELTETFEVGGVEGRYAGPEFNSDALQPIRVTRGEDHFGSFGARETGRREPHAGTAADHHDGLPEECRFALGRKRRWLCWS
jgi:hypothetical protein